MLKHIVRQLFNVLLGLIFCGTLQAQIVKEKVNTEGQPPGSYKIHSYDRLWKNELEIRKYDAEHPEIFRTKPLYKNAWTFIVGSAHSWYADNLITGNNADRYLVPSTCRAVGTNCYVFVEDTSWNLGRVTQAEVDSVRLYFDSKTPANPTKGIFETDTSTYGNPPDIDSDPKIIILLLDILDGYSGGGFVAGYFYSFNEHPAEGYYATSNEAEIFFIDTNPMNLKLSWGLEMGLSTLAHEFQHMIHYNYDPSEITFINEGCSTLAEVVCGYDIYNPTLYAQEPNHYLLDWRGSLTTGLNDYSRSARFMVYLSEQAGIGAVKNIVASTQHGTAGINAGLTASGSSLTFDIILQNWFIANILDDRTIDPAYGYIYPNLPKCNGINLYNPNVALTTDTVQRYAVQYVSFLSGSDLRATITRSNAALIIKAVEIGPSAKRVLDVTSGVEFHEAEFGTTYTEVHFVIMNTSASTSYTYTYEASGANSSIELRYDYGEPTSYYTLSINDTVCVWFDAVAGGKLDSIRVALRRAGTMNGGIWTYTGVLRPTPLGTKLATISATVTSTPTYPYPVPWNNWGTADVTSENIYTDSPFAVAFICAGDPSTEPRIMHVLSPMPSTLTSYVYLNSGSNWYYIGDNNDNDSVSTWMIRAYVSFPTGVSENIELSPSKFSLEQNYPNPFNPATRIQFYIPSKSYVTLRVYDIIGREVATLVNGNMNTGTHTVEFNASHLPSGVYIYRVTAGTYSESKKLVLIK